jgi:hypothetical protein
VNLGDTIDTIKSNIETSPDATREVGLEINVEKAMLAHHQNAGQNRDIKIGN